MRLIQLRDDGGDIRVGVIEGEVVRLLDGVETTCALANAAIVDSHSLDDEDATRAGATTLAYAPLLREGRVPSPLHHPDPAHCLVTFTGLTHLGSAAARDDMHQK